LESARLATAADLATLVRLWDEAVADLDGQRGGAPLAGSLTRADLHHYLASAVEDPDRLLVVGLIDAVPVGLASLSAVRDLPEPLARLELIYVEPWGRQVGVAESMLAVAMELCPAWGIAGVDAPALPGNRDAKAFFESNGFQARLLVMHRPILGDRGG
jgi:ribosomal protein S18 acetylase RimI-like enzyme